MSAPPRDERFEWLFVLGFVSLVLGGFVFEIVRDYHPVKLAAVFLVGWRFVLLPVHELGHALAARLVGTRVAQLVVGHGSVLAEGVVFGIPCVVRAWPIEGFVRFAPRDVPLSRGASALTYAAGVCAEAIVVLALVVPFGMARLFVRSDAISALLVQTAAIELALSVVANLVPRTARLGGPDAPPIANDGLGILRSLFGP